ncbi:MAG: amino acid adenylation domain-containing protein, partial [Prevotella sp.]|nr:amino acid adenylation domain-containing protein [Prevotella sp.]
VAVLGVWKAGGAYLPLGSEYPKDRLKFMLEDAESSIMLTESAIWTDMADAGLPASTLIKLDEFDFSAAAEPVNHAVADGLAYMIYTSGSTGKPKGTMLEHANLRAFNEWLVRLVDMKSGDIITEHASFSFDGSCLDLYPALTVGGTVHILNDEIRRDMPALVDYFKANNVKGCFLTTRLAQDLLNNFDLPLEYLMMGGEKNFGFRPSKVKVYEVYGPTETTILATAGLTDQTFPDPDNITIGRPAPNLTMYITDANGNLAPNGMAGELCIAGPQVARGYWKRADLTAEKFVTPSFDTSVRMYRTGDLCRWDSEGNIMFLGRIDNQVKLRGFRIEFGEVESAMSKIAGITTAIVDIKTVNGIQHLVAYYTSDTEIDEEAMREELSKSLTDYMVPTAYVRMDAMPLNPNGKVDHKKLPLPVLKMTEYVAPQNDTEQTIADAFRDCLNLSSPVGREDSFYALGGDSIKAIRLVSYLRKANMQISVAQIIKFQKVMDIASAVVMLDEAEEEEFGFDMVNIPMEESFASEEEYQAVSERFAAKGESLERAYPLTPMQEGMLAVALSTPESSAYHITFRLALDVLPTEEQIAYALNKLASKREVLRTSIIYKDIEEPCQAIVAGRQIPLEMVDYTQQDNIRAAIDALDDKEFNRYIDLQDDALFRVVGIKTGDNACLLLFTAHHAIMDGWCTGLWTKDFTAFLQEALDGKAKDDDFSDMAGRYESYVRELGARDKDTALTYWRELLAGYETKAEIPVYEKVTAENASEHDDCRFYLPSEKLIALDRLCREVGCSINNTVEAAWSLVLQTYNRTDDVVFVKVVSGRDNSQEDCTDIVGLFINSVPVRIKTDKDATLLDVVKTARSQAAETSDYDWCPLSEIQKQSEMGTNLFQSILVFENFEAGEATSGHSFNSELQAVRETNVSEIELMSAVKENGLSLNIKFDNKKYPLADIQTLGHTLVQVLEAIIAKPELPARSATLVTDDDVKEQLKLGFGGSMAYDTQEVFMDMFLRQVSLQPDAIAVVDSKSSLTYRELDELSNALAAKL